MTQIRGRALEELGHGVFDVLVIGAGIVRSRVAWDAAWAGLRVALVDAGILAGRRRAPRPGWFTAGSAT